MEKRYEKYTAADFLTDDFFISSFKNEDPEVKEFWKNWENSQPLNIQEFKAAREELLIILSAKRYLPVEGEEQEIYGRILNSVDAFDQRIASSGKGVRKVFKMNFSFWAAAASVLIILGVGYFYFAGKDAPEKRQLSNKEMIQEDLQPGGNRAILTLSNGQQIILDSMHNGSLGNQGNASIIKLTDGSIVYKEVNEKPTEVVYNSITTPRGGQYQVELADGSKVWLNAASSLRFPAQFGGSSRKVELRGEAYFEIAKVEGKTFEVSLSDGAYIQVLGTHFNVMGYENEGSIETTLFEGSVKILKGNEQQTIIPGQQLILESSSGAMRVNNSPNPESVLAWKNGKFNLDGENIQSIMNQVARWYDVEVVYNGKVTRDFGGSISRNVSASDLFKVLEATGGVRFTIEGKKVIVSP